ncbi:MAG: extracellular solute-binding protein [Oscillospiraceae bacterium]|jgi:putative aldouronate transport system substrate-binding protein|nr:extracellular solute-binding protein [Oscillospiraceae bacterium]
MKKTIALLIAALMLAGLLAACASDSPTAGSPSAGGQVPASAQPPTENKSEGHLLAEQYGLPYTPLSEADPITYTYFIRDPGSPPASSNPIIQAIEKITNTKIEFEYLVGDLETKISIMLASGDWNDMAYFGGESRPFMDSGLTLPLQDLITQNAPNLRAHFDPWWELMKHNDGNIYVAEIYGTPTNREYINEHWGTAFWLQKDVLDHFGRAPKDLDEYFDFIREYMALYPTIDGVPTIGFEILTEGWRRFCIDNPPMFMAGYGNWGPAAPDNQLSFNSVTSVGNRWTNDWNKPYYKKLNEEYHLGTISAETLVRSFDDYLATLASGAVLGLSDQLWNFNNGLDPLRAESRFERTYLPLDFTYAGVEPKYLDQRAFTGSNGIIVNKNIKQPERLMQYMDWLIQEDVQKFIRWGIESEHWFYNSEGRMERPQEQRDFQQETKWMDDNIGLVIYNQFPKMQGSYSDGNATDPTMQPEEYYAGLADYDRTLFDKLGIKNQTGLMRSVAAEWPVYYPYWSMAFEEQSPAGLADTRLTDVNQRYLANLVICAANEFDALWDEYVAAMNAVDAQPLYDAIMEQSQTRFDAVHN